MIIDGRKIADERLKDLRSKIKNLKKKPKLAIILIGDDPASEIYVNLKVKKARELGIETEVRQDLNTDADGIIVQLPGGEDLIEKIPPEKDVDGLTGKSKFLPATVKAILIILDRFRLGGRNDTCVYVIVGQGRLVGRPLADYLEKNNFKVIRCDEFTQNLKEETLKGDVLVVATGKEKLITADMVKSGAIVIDCGAPKAEVDPAVSGVAHAISPVPGGIGPVTVVCLLENLVEATYNATNLLWQ